MWLYSSILYLFCKCHCILLTEQRPTEEGSVPSSKLYTFISPRHVGTADVQSLNSRYYGGCIAANDIDSKDNVEDCTNQTEANDESTHYSEIQE